MHIRTRWIIAMINQSSRLFFRELSNKEIRDARARARALKKSYLSRAAAPAHQDKKQFTELAREQSRGAEDEVDSASAGRRLMPLRNPSAPRRSTGCC